MAGITERNQQQNDLVGAGFDLRYIDGWPSRTTLYRHKASYNEKGEINDEIGSSVSGVPGSPDYVLRKAKIGLYPWPPNEGCTCKWCVEGKGKEARELVPSENSGKSTKRIGPL